MALPKLLSESERTVLMRALRYFIAGTDDTATREKAVELLGQLQIHKTVRFL